MNQLEGFLIKLNSLQNDQQNLAHYLFSQNDGWSFVRSVYTKEIQVNLIIMTEVMKK